MTNFEKVKRWMRIAGQATPDKPTPVDMKTHNLRKTLIREEILHELFPAMDEGDLVGVADGLADALYVIYGTAAAYGIDIDRIFSIVHTNNMTKFNPCDHGGPVSSNEVCGKCNGENWVAILREDGKVLKNETWQPPDLKTALGLQ